VNDTDKLIMHLKNWSLPFQFLSVFFSGLQRIHVTATPKRTVLICASILAPCSENNLSNSLLPIKGRKGKKKGKKEKKKGREEGRKEGRKKGRKVGKIV
jgi:hypothetical protein